MSGNKWKLTEIGIFILKQKATGVLTLLIIIKQDQYQLGPNQSRSQME